MMIIYHHIQIYSLYRVIAKKTNDDVIHIRKIDPDNLSSRLFFLYKCTKENINLSAVVVDSV